MTHQFERWVIYVLMFWLFGIFMEGMTGMLTA